MLWLLVGLLTAVGQPSAAIDVAAVRIGPPRTVVELDLGKLKGDLRQVGWAPDASQLYVQTAERPDKLSHYIVTVAGGAIETVPDAPAWAKTYWAFKSDRSAPGIASLMIDIATGSEAMKGLPPEGSVRGTGVDAGQLSDSNATKASVNVVVLRLLGENVGEFENTKPIPGLTFSWGPEHSGAIAYVDRDGRLMLLDQHRHKQTIAGVKDAILPAWTADGARLAYARKTGRRKYALVWSDVSR